MHRAEIKNETKISITIGIANERIQAVVSAPYSNSNYLACRSSTPVLAFFFNTNGNRFDTTIRLLLAVGSLGVTVICASNVFPISTIAENTSVDDFCSSFSIRNTNYLKISIYIALFSSSNLQTREKQFKKCVLYTKQQQ